ncbi:MAG: amidohydrolase family protein [Prochlorococcaceae cyanobacterium]
MRKIALEEHANLPVFANNMNAVCDLFSAEFLAAVEERLVDYDQLRLAAMDAGGIEIAVLSQTSPGVQALENREAAVDAARRCNDLLAHQIARHPSRFRGFACVALQDPEAAAAELERCVQEHGFVGALVNGHTQGHYLDEPGFTPFWRMLERLDVPLYLHPAAPFRLPHVLQGVPALDGAVWSWTGETASHALRLVFGGVFERHPGARLILGHMGETLPFELWRLDSRSAILPESRRPPRPPSETLREHLWITTSGVCADGPLQCSLHELGEERVLFSVDYPYEDSHLACRWIEGAAISDAARQKVCFGNASTLLNLP